MEQIHPPVSPTGHALVPAAPAQPSFRAFLVIMGLIFATLGLIALCAALNADDGAALPPCRTDYMVDDHTMVVPQVDGQGYVVGYDTKACEVYP